MSTPIRSVRVPDDLWQLVQSKARAEKKSASQIILLSLNQYVQGEDALRDSIAEDIRRWMTAPSVLQKPDEERKVALEMLRLSSAIAGNFVNRQAPEEEA